MEMLAANSGIILFLVLGFGIFIAWGMGANDVANAMGTSAAVVQTVQDGGAVAAKSGIPWWVFLIGGAGIVLGLATYCSWRVIGTGLPISSTHTLIGALLGVGLAHGTALVDFKVAKQMVGSWRVTLPIAVVLPISVYFPLNALLG